MVPSTMAKFVQALGNVCLQAVAHDNCRDAVIRFVNHNLKAFVLLI